MNLVVHGSRASDSLVTVDGMPIINGSGTGGLHVRQLPEQRAGSGDHLPDRLAQRRVRARHRLLELHPEGRLESVPRLVLHAATPARGWQSDNLDDEQISQGLRSGNRINRIWDVNPAPAARSSRIGSGSTAATVTGAPTTRWPARSRTRTSPTFFYTPTHGAEPVPGVAPERRGALHRADQSEEQGQRLLRLAVHLLRQLLRADVSDRDQRLPGVQEHPAVHRPGQLELAGQ